MAEMSVMFMLGLFVVGLLVGAISPALGIGGGILTVPILIMGYGFEGDAATATSLGVVILTTLSGTIAYLREKRIDFKLALIFMFFAIPGSLLGATLSLWFKGQNFTLDILQVLFAGFMLTIAVLKLLSMYLPNKKIKTDSTPSAIPKEGDERPWWKSNIIHSDFLDKENQRFTYTVKIFPQITVVFLGGLIGSLLGLGGGVIYVPVLTMFMGVPMGIAAATSTFTILISNALPVLIRVHSIQWEYVLFLGLGTVISASIIPKYLSKVNSQWILNGFWVLVIVASIRIIMNVLGLAI